MNGLKRVAWYAGFGAVAAFALIVGGCSGDSPRMVTEDDSGSTLSLAVGDEFTILLEENPTTGYSWELKFGAGLRVLSDAYEAPSPSPSPGPRLGAGGVHRWVVKVVSSGSAEVTGVYRRPWEPATAKPAQVFNLTVDGQ